MISAEFLKRLNEVNASRCVRWHGDKGVMDWSSERWLTATLGELGELAMSANDPLEVTYAEAADTAIYAELFAQRIGVKLYEDGPGPKLTHNTTFTADAYLIGCTAQLGEAANALKKAFRIEAGMANISDKERQISTLDNAYKIIGQHLRNLIWCLDELCHGELEVAITKKFNATSKKYGFPERL